MPGHYHCVNCGHEGYTYGSTIWVQGCPKCHKPVGLLRKTPLRVKGPAERMTSHGPHCQKVLINTLKPGEAGLLTEVFIDTFDTAWVEVGDLVWAKLYTGQLGLPVSKEEKGFYYVTQVKKADGRILRTNLRNRVVNPPVKIEVGCDVHD